MYEIYQESLNGFALNSRGTLASWSLAQASLKVKVKDQRSRSLGTKNVIFRPFRRHECGLCLVRHLRPTEGSVFGGVSLWVFRCVLNISGTAERICAKFTRKTCLIPRSDEFEGQRQRSKVTRDRNGIFRPFRRPACGLCFVFIFSLYTVSQKTFHH